MEFLLTESAARSQVVVLGLFIALLAIFAWKLAWPARFWGAAAALSTAGYALCTGLASFAGDTLRPIDLPLLLVCAGLPAIFWAFVRALFNDELRLSWFALFVVLLTALLGLLASSLADLPPQAAAIFAVLRRALAIFLVLWTLFELAKGAAVDLVSERLNTRRILLCLSAIYMLVVLIVEIWIHGPDIPAGLQTANLLSINVLMIAFAVAVSRWDLREPPGGAVVADSKPLAVPFEPAVIELDSRRLEATADTELITRLNQVMSDDKLYCQEGLTIARLAAHLDTQEHGLRRAINQHLGFRNYNEFLHQYRLNDAEQRLADAAQTKLPILTIALDVGYSSIGPFNRAFKARHGITPSEFRRRAK